MLKNLSDFYSLSFEVIEKITLKKVLNLNLLLQVYDDESINLSSFQNDIIFLRSRKQNLQGAFNDIL